jgi:hypothetical protein
MKGDNLTCNLRSISHTHTAHTVVGNCRDFPRTPRPMVVGHYTHTPHSTQRKLNNNIHQRSMKKDKKNLYFEDKFL